MEGLGCGVVGEGEYLAAAREEKRGTEERERCGFGE